MFRTSEPPNSMDEPIKKATSETLTTDDWQEILQVCDTVNTNPETNTPLAIKSVISRLKSTDANVNLRALTLVVALAENCGSRMKQEIASKSFVGLFMDKIYDSKVHTTVKSRVVEVMDQLSQSFKSDISLRGMKDSYDIVVNQFPNLKCPAVPEKFEITESDKSREENELKEVLRLSLNEYEKKEGWKKKFLNNNQEPAATSENNSQINSQTAFQPVVQSTFQPTTQPTFQTTTQPIHQSSSYKPVEQAQTGQLTQQEQKQSNVSNEQSISESKKQGTTQSTATITKVRALYDLTTQEEDELSFRKGDIITVIESVYRDWWRGSLRGNIGIFPLNYVTPIRDPTPEEIMKETKLEHEILKESRNIEKLLAVLSNKNLQFGEDAKLDELYLRISPLRPQLGKLIEKYSVKKDDLISLNEKLGEAERLYAHMIDSAVNKYKTNQYPVDFSKEFSMMSLSQPPYPVSNSNFSQNSYPTSQQTSLYQPHQQTNAYPQSGNPKISQHSIGGFTPISQQQTESNSSINLQQSVINQQPIGNYNSFGQKPTSNVFSSAPSAPPGSDYQQRVSTQQTGYNLQPQQIGPTLLPSHKQGQHQPTDYPGTQSFQQSTHQYQIPTHSTPSVDLTTSIEKTNTLQSTQAVLSNNNSTSFQSKYPPGFEKTLPYPSGDN